MKRTLGFLVGVCVLLVACGSTSAVGLEAHAASVPAETATSGNESGTFECPDRRPGDWESTPDPLGDYADVIRIDGRSYEHAFQNDGVLEVGDLRSLVGNTCFRIADVTLRSRDDGYDGDATYLPVGTEIREIVGANRRIRLAAVLPEGVRIYESFDHARALDGSEVIDFDSGLAEIGINSEEDGTTRLATIDEPDLVAAVVDAVRTTPVERDTEPDFGGPRVFLEFVWSDGTSTIRPFWLESGYLHFALWLGDETTGIVREQVGGVGSELSADDASANQEPDGPGRISVPDCEDDAECVEGFVLNGRFYALSCAGVRPEVVGIEAVGSGSFLGQEVTVHSIEEIDSEVIVAVSEANGCDR